MKQNRKENKMQKYTLNDIKRAWNFCYGEDIKTEYTGFYLHLKNKKYRENFIINLKNKTKKKGR
jgi:hypothetical protein